MSAEFPGEQLKEPGEIDADFMLRQCAYNDGRFAKPYGSGYAEFKAQYDFSKASTDQASLQKRVDAYKAGAHDRHEHNMAILRKAGIVVGSMAVIGGCIQLLRMKK